MAALSSQGVGKKSSEALLSRMENVRCDTATAAEGWEGKEWALEFYLKKGAEIAVSQSFFRIADICIDGIQSGNSPGVACSSLVRLFLLTVIHPPLPHEQ